jgi:glycopeptide antibiotics resistance protein
MYQIASRILAWAFLILLFVVTDTTMALRPETLISPPVDRYLALFVVGAIFSFAYPRHIVWVVAILFVFIVGFELIQRLIAGRHGYLKDIVVKGAGCCAGAGFAVVLRHIFSKRAPPLS